MGRLWRRYECAGERSFHRFRLSVAAVALCVILCVLLALTGCVATKGDGKKLRDLEFTVLDRETIPQELAALIEEKKDAPFRLTYADQGYLYIARGYGSQPTTGYSVEVNGLCETEDAVCIHTNLSGPEKGEETKEIATFPYVVIQLEYIEKEVLFDQGGELWN